MSHGKGARATVSGVPWPLSEPAALAGALLLLLSIGCAPDAKDGPRSSGPRPLGTAPPASRPAAPATGPVVPVTADALFPDARSARRVVFLVDASGSTVAVAKELRMTVADGVNLLGPAQAFNVVLFGGERTGQFDASGPLAANEVNRRKAADFLDGAAPAGETDSAAGLEATFRQNPDLVYLVTDADFRDDPAVLAKLRELNARGAARVHTIALTRAAEVDPAVAGALRDAAASGGGTYRQVNVESLGLRP